MSTESKYGARWGWESCVSPGQNSLPNLSDEELAAEISVSLAPVPWTAQPPAPGCTQGRALGSSGEAQPRSSGSSNSSKPPAFCTVTSQRSLTHPVSSKPPFPAALVHSCCAVTEAQLSSSPPPAPRCCPQSGWPLLLTPSSAAGGHHHHPLPKNSNSAQMP